MTDLFAYLACAVLAALTIFQLALIMGLPIGKYAWGGAHSVLPVKLRIGSAVSILLYAIFATIITDSAGITSVFTDERIASAGIWALAGYFFVGVFMNGISRSKPERNLMTPVAFALMLLCLGVAVG